MFFLSVVFSLLFSIKGTNDIVEPQSINSGFVRSISHFENNTKCMSACVCVPVLLFLKAILKFMIGCVHLFCFVLSHDTFTQIQKS